MKSKDKTITKHWNGSVQNQRMFKALLPEFVQIDERATSDMLAFVSSYSQLINYYTPENARNGDWSRFFDQDISVFIASIIATDLRQIERTHAQLIGNLENAPRTEEKLECLEELFHQVLQLKKQINDWYTHSLQMTRLNPSDSTELENELENAIKQQLSKNLQALIQYQRDLDFLKSGIFSEAQIEETFHSMWFKQHDRIADRPIELATSSSIEDKIRDYTKKIRILFRTAYSVTAYILQIAPKFLQKTLVEKDDHRPDVGLFIAFVELFKHVQNQLNTITEQHLDFYYYDVLRMKERGYGADQINVYFELAKHIDVHFLPKGTLLTGRDEAGQEVFYKTDADIELNQAQIQELKTVLVSKNPKIGIGSSYRLITNLYAAPVANSKNGQGERFINNEEDWPTFGEELLDKPEAERQMTFADIGWAISAPILEMEEGHRIVTMRLEFDKTSMYTLNLLIKDISRNLQLSREDAFSKIFRNSLRVYITSLFGWQKADTCEVLPPSDWDLPEISLVATFSSSAPPIVGYYNELHGEGFDTSAPVLKILHQNIDAIFSYSFLKELVLNRIFIDVTAKGLKRLALSSDLGGLDPSLPFQPFGPIPKVGSYFLIGKAELFKKELTDLQINIEWHTLPDHNKGFRGHYREYELGITNDAYKVRLTALSDGNFTPSEDDAPIDLHLFYPNPEHPQNVHKYTTWDNIDVKAFGIKPDYKLQLPAAFSNEVRAGYLKVEFVAPKVAFGHDQYANIYTKAVTNNANPKKKEDLALPNQPYVPVVKALTLDYAATAQVNVISIGTINKGDAVEEQLYHLHPYGIVRTFYRGKTENRNLVPTYEDDSYLYIGLSDLNAPSSLSLYFELKDNPDNLDLSNANAAKPEVLWSYLVNNQWRDFSQTQILSDTTNSFNNSGIITFDIPRDIVKNNQLLNKNLHWIRATVKGDATIMPRTLKVATQALSATWVPQEGQEGEHLENRLAPNTIESLAHSISEIRGVVQPFKSFGGRPAESKKEFYTRTSERLRHKNRAVSAWDYERLVLDKFPDIYQAKCVTHLGNEEHVEKGSVVITVVPRIPIEGTTALPRVNYAELQNIKEYLQSLSSPFVNIEVRNPIYERVKVTAGVRFTKGKNNGTFLKKLNHDIMEFMCPWLRGISRELDLGGFVSKDVILSFIEKRPYVEFVTKFSAVQVFYDENAKVTGFDIDDTAIDTSSSPIIKASKPWSVLIPFETNPLYLMDEATFQTPEKSSINSMIINGDFLMTEEKDLDINYLDTKKRKS